MFRAKSIMALTRMERAGNQQRLRLERVSQESMTIRWQSEHGQRYHWLKGLLEQVRGPRYFQLMRQTEG